MQTKKAHDKGGKPGDVLVKPKLKDKFKPSKAKEIIIKVLDKKLVDVGYQAEKIQFLIKEIAETIKGELKGLGLQRYKYIVQVVVGEQKGQGLRIGGRCFWDNDTDCCVSESRVNDLLFCLVTVNAVYVY